MGRVKDSDRRQQAFILFCKYGSARKAAQELGINPSILSRWRKEDNWDTRAKVFQQTLDEQLNEAALSALESRRVEHMNRLGVLHGLESKVKEVLFNGAVTPNSWRDILATLKFVYEERERLYLSNKDLVGNTEDNIIDVEAEETSQEVLKALESSVGAFADKNTPPAEENDKEDLH